MMEFYHALSEVNPNHQNMTMTVIKGDAFGEKAILSGSRLVWESKHCGFFSVHQEKIGQIHESGVAEVGGQSVFCELLGREKKFVVCGGGHVSIPIIRMGQMLGCSITVLEDRPKFADHARRAGAADVICEPFEDGLKKVAGDEDTFFIIVTRGHRYDQVCLESIIKKPHAYIGMIGSRRRVAKVKDAIIKNGGSAEVLSRVHTPIGLDIGAETPEEIAIAVLAEIIQVKNKKKRSCGYSREIMREISRENAAEESKVLATIVSRKGSAPRGAGTKMLVLSDGNCIGTIGGGCVESDILKRALFMIRTGKREPEICHVDMTEQNAEEEGMVCGGVIDVMLEVI